MPKIADGQLIQWAFTPQKQPVAPFITELEDGETVWREFVADNALSAKPTLSTSACINEGVAIGLSWGEVDGADGYKYEIFDVTANQSIMAGTVEGATQAPSSVSGAAIYPHQYQRRVSAGIKDSNGDWIFGPQATGNYNIKPPAPTVLTPNNQEITLDASKSVHFTWQNESNPTNSINYQFDLIENLTNFNPLLASELTPNKEAIVEGLVDMGGNYSWTVFTVDVCPGSVAAGSFTTAPEPQQPDPDPQPINSDLAFVLYEETNDDFDMIIKTPSGHVFTYNEFEHYVQDPAGGSGPDIAFLKTPKKANMRSR